MYHAICVKLKLETEPGQSDDSGQIPAAPGGSGSETPLSSPPLKGTYSKLIIAMKYARSLTCRNFNYGPR